MIKSVLFDMDGLLLDSEHLYEKAAIASAAELGYTITPELYAKTMGASNLAGREIYRAHFGADYPAEEVENRTYAKVYEFVGDANLNALKKGVFEILNTLEQMGIKKAVASSNNKDFVMFALEHTNIKNRFDAIVTADDVQHAKPAPDIFLKAAQLLDTAPEHCLVLEDSFNGVTAAHNAHIPVIMVPDLTQPTEDIRAKTFKVLQSLHEVEQYIREEQALGQ
ncbi:HAD superfamily hydrolase (TIGR01509 family) [Elusimicrobium posterum]|uniref:HAD family hydrolase n=1 Tax=Elusimicrobium posterum TaxID=3116653 RepID=UPI003C735FD6